MYRKKRPNIGDIVICRVTEVLDIGSYVELLEYDNIQGMIGVTEYSKQRIRSISKLINVDKIIVAEVLRVDDNYIDLAKKTVTFDEMSAAQDTYELNKKVQLVARRMASDQADVEAGMLHIYETILWDLPLEEQEHLATYLQKIGHNKVCCDNQSLVEACKVVFPMKEETFVGILGMACFHAEGIDMVKKVLNLSKQNTSIKITYSGNGKSYLTEYIYTLTSTNESEAIQLVNSAMEVAVKEMQSIVGGMAQIVEKAKKI